MIRFLIERPVSVLMVYLAIVLLGIVSFFKIPVSLLPDVAIPEITIQVSAPDKSAVQMEENYIARIRRSMQQVAHLEDVETFATNGSSRIRLVFDFGTDLQYAFIEVNEKIDALMQNMPDEFERPRVIKASSTDIPVFYLSVGLKEGLEDGLGNRFMELSAFSEQVIKRRIEQLSEVAMVDISGMEYPEIHIQIDLGKLEILGLNPQSLQSVLEQNNLSASNIKVRNGLYEFNVKYSSLLKNRQDIENLTLLTGNRIFKLSDVANVMVKPRSGKGYTLDKTNKVITMAVIKKSTARMEELKQKTNELLDAIRKDYPRLRFEVTRNQTELLDYSIANLKSSLAIGAILAFLVLFLFMKDLRSPLLIGISIPVSLIVSLLAFYLLDVSINIISLSGLVVGVGLMIDNSIIVIDNINQSIKSGKGDLVEDSATGVVEVITPLISSALTTCAVFVPLIFLGGIAGALFYDQAISISIGLASSLIVSVTIIPVLFVLFSKSRWKSIKLPGSKAYLENAYEIGCHWVVNHKSLFTFGTFVLLVGGAVVYFVLDKERLPAMEQQEVVATIDWNQNIHIDENRKRIESLISDFSDYTATVSASVGDQWFLMDWTNNLTNTQAQVYFKSHSEDSLKLFVSELEGWMKDHFPRANYELHPPENLFERVFNTSQSPLEVRLSANGAKPYPDAEILNEIISSIQERTGLKPTVKPAMQEVYELKPQFEKLLLYEVDPNILIQTLRASMNQLSVFTLRQGQTEVPVVISEKESKDIDHILQTTQVRSGQEALIPVNQLLIARKILGYKSLSGDANHPFVRLPYAVKDSEVESVIREVEAVMDKFPNIMVDFSGSIYQTRQLLSELWIIFLVAVLLLYFILASQFESLLQPLIVFIEIPIDIAGALLFLWLFGQSFNLLALIGMIVMSGIIINDSILKIDTINRLRKTGLSIDDAIRKGGKRRLKPIIMTSATTILAMVPFLWGSDMGSVLQRPFAVAIIGGMLIGTFVSLYFIPIAYRAIYQKSSHHGD